MSLRGAISDVVRGTLLAAIVAGAAFGALTLFAPFGGKAPPPAPESSAGALLGRIDALRLSLRNTEAALAAARPQPAAATDNPHDAQIAAATERRDLARRHAEAIRDALAAGTPVAALAGIRDSVVIGQLLARRTALDGEIAEAGARLRPTHPTMRALLAQRDALATQIRQEATSIATALETEARIDDAQIVLLRDAAPVTIAAADNGALLARATAERAELDGLVDTYLNLPAAPATAAPQAETLAPANLALAGLAGLATLAVQVLLVGRRRRRVRAAADLAAWQADADLEAGAVPAAAPLRRAS